MTKHPSKSQTDESQPERVRTENGVRPGERLEDVLSQAKTAASDFLANNPGKQVTELSQEWATEATQFIRRNPWAAVLGAAVIGYYLGSTRNRSGGSR